MPESADSSFFQLAYKKETTFGEAPTGAYQEMRINGESVNFSPEYVTSQELRNDRQVPDLIQVGAEVGGDIPFELSYGSYDEWFEAAFFNEFTTAVSISGATDITATNDDGSGNSEFTSVTTNFVTEGIQAGMHVLVAGFTTAGNNGYFQVKAVAANVLTLVGTPLTDEASGDSIDMSNDGMLVNGVDKQSFSMEKRFGDVSQYQLLSGCRVAGFQLNFAAGEILNGQFSVLGTVASVMTSASVLSSVTAADTNDKMNAVSDLTNIEKDDASITSDLMELSITHDNGLRGQPAIGVLGYKGIGAGRSNTTGSINVYLDSTSVAAFYNAGVSNTAFKLKFRLTDNDGNAYIFTLYRMKLNELSNNADAIDTDVMINSGFQAVLDKSGVSGKTIQIDRFTA